MAMKKLVDGIHSFQRNSFRKDEQLFEGLAAGQNPLALFITCSDSRVDPNLLTQTKPGELFILRTAGNIVPPYGSITGGEAATIEYAISALKIRNIVVCGHSHCGAMSGLLAPDSLKNLPAVRTYLQHAETTRHNVKEKHAQITDPADRLTRTVEENVLVQLENLKTHPSVATAVEGGDLSLHGWVYKFETGEVFAFDPKRAQFVLIDDIDGTGV